MKYDDLLTNYVGEFGRYQKFQLALVCLPVMMTAMQMLSWTFAAADLDHSSLPFEQCIDGYVYDNSDITNSAINKWEISCDRYFIKAVIQSLYYLGQGIGALAFGIMSDRIGRKKTFLFAIPCQALAGLGMAAAPWSWLFGILRTIVGFGQPGIFLISVVISMELVGPSRRFIGGILIALVMSLGQVVLGAIAYGVRDFQTLMLVISLPYGIFIPYIWLVPESARWLMSQGRYDEANEILKKAAKCNGRELPDDVIKQVDTDVKQQSDKKYGFFDLFRFSGMRKRTLLSYYCWFGRLITNRVARIAVSGVYYGISMNPNVFGGDRYLTFILAGAAEFPAILLSCLFVNRLGRKLLLVVGFLLTAFFMFITLAFDEENTGILIASVILAKSSISMTYAIIYVFTPELYPTVLRNTATGSCSMVSRVGAISASYVAMYLIEYSRIAVVLIFGSFSISAAVVVTFQPETSGLTLPETVEEAEQIGKHGNIISFKPQHPQTRLKIEMEPEHDE